MNRATSCSENGPASMSEAAVTQDGRVHSSSSSQRASTQPVVSIDALQTGASHINSQRSVTSEDSSWHTSDENHENTVKALGKEVQHHPEHERADDVSRPNGGEVTKEKSCLEDQEASKPRSRETIHNNVPPKARTSHFDRQTFPGQLHELLAFEDVHDIICWLPDGDAFVIKNVKHFVKKVLPNYFKKSKFESFTRKLNRWGFRRIPSELYPNDVVYFHRCFVRDSPNLYQRMSGAPKQDNRCLPVVHCPTNVAHDTNVPPQAIRPMAVGSNQHSHAPSHPGPEVQACLATVNGTNPFLPPQHSPLFDALVHSLEGSNYRFVQAQGLQTEIDARRRALTLLQTPDTVPPAALYNAAALGVRTATELADHGTIGGLAQIQHSLNRAAQAQGQALAALLNLQNSSESVISTLSGHRLGYDGAALRGDRNSQGRDEQTLGIS